MVGNTVWRIKRRPV